MKTDKKDELVRQRARKLRLANDGLDRRHIDQQAVLRIFDACIAEAEKIYAARLTGEWPRGMVGLDVPSGRGFGRRLGDEVRSDMQKLAELWKK
jgi:Glu-tRNA(Gln) amidotransferase subunit E-like FAD-binding protein